MMPRIAPITAAVLLVLIAINVWLILALTRDFDPTEGRPGERQQQVSGLVPDASEPATPRPISAYKGSLARPVFFKTRQPYVPPPPAPPPPAKVQPPPAPVVPIDPGLLLGGVIINGEERKAYVVSKADAQGAWLGEGEAIKGWTLQTVDADGAKLQQAGRTIELYLYPPQR